VISAVNVLPLELQAQQLLIQQAAAYVSDLLWRAKYYPTKAVPVAGVSDTLQVFYNPENLKSRDKGEVTFIVLHEFAHYFLEHHQRFKALTVPEMFQNDHEAFRNLWNICVDLEVNGLLKAMGLTPPPDAQMPAMYDFPRSQLAEEYLRLFLENLEEEQSKGKGKGKGKGGPGQNLTMPTVGGNESGSAADGQRREHEGDRGQDGDVSSEAEQKALIDGVAKRVQEAVGKHAGTVPGQLRRWAEARMNSQVPWQKLLRSAVRRAVQVKSGDSDFSYRRPSKRSPKNLILPSRIGTKPTVSIVIDTSGSMSETDLAAALAEVKAALKQVGTLEIVSVDARVTSQKTVHKLAQVDLSGGGGTNMGVGLQALTVTRPDVAVVLTDGYTPWPQVNPLPRSKVVVGVIGQTGGDLPDTPTWTRRIEIHTGKE